MQAKPTKSTKPTLALSRGTLISQSPKGKKPYLSGDALFDDIVWFVAVRHSRSATRPEGTAVLVGYTERVTQTPPTRYHTVA